MALTISQAIATMEGFYKTGTRPQRNNNPGDLEYHIWMSKYGSMKSDGRFAIFPTVTQGFAALQALLRFPVYKGKTIEAAINTFAPPTENATTAYVSVVCHLTGLTPDTIIDEYI